MQNVLVATCMFLVLASSLPINVYRYKRNDPTCSFEVDSEVSRCQDLRILQEEMDKITLANARESLHNFSRKLKQYVNATDFDAPRFRSQKDRLSEELVGIGRMVLMPSMHEQIYAQLSFTTQMYRAMESAAEYLKGRFLYTLPDQALAYDLIALNLHILVLHDSYGHLDLRIKQLTERVLTLHGKLEDLGREYGRLDCVFPSALWVIKAQVSWAQKSLRQLWSQIPDRQTSCECLESAGCIDLWSFVIGLEGAGNQ